MNSIQKLADLLGRHATEDGMHPCGIPGLWLVRSCHPTEPAHVLHEPAVCFVAQGRKQVMLAEQTYVYDSAKYLVVSVDLPISGQVIEASPPEPYLCVRLDLDPAMLAELIAELPGLPVPAQPARGLCVGDITEDLTDAMVRLVRLLDHPADLPTLAPLVLREIHYRLLAGDQGETVRALAVSESKSRQIGRAIAWIKRHYDQPFSLEAVAAEARMSASSLHLHFKAITAMSPLQYQKQLRLQQARRLMLASGMDVAQAAYEVGYESPSQFTREYSRLFGAPPARDMAQFRQKSVGAAPASKAHAAVPPDAPAVAPAPASLA